MALLGAPVTLWTWLDPIVTCSLAAIIAIIICVVDAICYKQTNSQVTHLLASDGKITTSHHMMPSANDEHGFVASLLDSAVDDDDGIMRQLHPASMVFPWGLCLEVAKAKRHWFQKNHTHLGWVLRNECSERDFRRLCRAVILVRKDMPSRKN